jgi:uncharacterized protein YukE
MPIFDPDDLVRIAARIEDQAAALRAKARSLTCAAHQLRWQSAAAATFRVQVLKLDRRIQQAAGDLDRAAHELRLHAHRVRTVEAAAAAAVRAERFAAHQGERVAVGTAHTLGHAGGWVANHL